MFVITELHQGGAENALAEVAGYLASQNHSVHVVCLFGGDGAVAERLRRQSIDVTDLHMNRPFSVSVLFNLHRLIARYKPDLIHSWLFHANLITRLSMPRKKILAASLRVVEPRHLHIWLDRLTRSRVKCYICVSSDVRQFAQEKIHVLPEKCRVIENGVNYAAFSRARHAQRSYDKIRGLSVGRLSHQKGFDILLKALADLAGKLQFEWHFAGASPDKGYAEKLYQMVDELDLTGHIVWHGQLNREELIELYGKANIFCLPSRWEGQPNVVLEALASGLPVLTAPVDGISDIYNGKAAGAMEIVTPNIPEQWEVQLRSLCTQKQRMQEMGRVATAAVAERSWTNVASQHLELYHQLLAQG